MNKISRNLGCLASLVLLANTLTAANITISDNNYTGSGWYSNREDNETESSPNTITTQQWDLEGMFLSGTTLTLVGGYDFKNGVTYNNKNYASGDIFIDTGANAVYGAAAAGAGTGGTTSNLYGYDYVMDLSFGPGNVGGFVIRDLHTGSNVLLNRPTDVASSGAWRYASGTNVATVGTGSFTYGQLTAAEVTSYGLLGGDATHGNNNNHYYLSIDVSYFSGTSDIFHYTMECGNDNLMGQARVPDSGTTLVLLGAGLLGLAGFRRNRKA